MPTIIADKQQLAAFNDVSTALDTVRNINSILGNDAGSLSIMFKPDKGRAVKVPLEKPQDARARAILSATKEALVKDIKKKASKYRIELDADDLNCMGNAPASQAGEEDMSEAVGDENPDGEGPDGEAQHDGTGDLKDAGSELADADSLGYGEDPFNM